MRESNPRPYACKVSESTGNKIRIWCLGEDLIRKIEQQIANTNTIGELRNILLKYPTLRDRIEPLCINRKKELESIVPDSIVEPPKTT